MLRTRFIRITENIPRSFVALTAYVVISIFFMFRLIASSGNAAQQDWSIPLTPLAAFNDLHSLLFAWQYGGFGEPLVRNFSLPYFQFLNSLLAPLGFFGGTEVKELSIFLVALAGITAYTLSRSLGLKFFSSFLSGVFYMTTPLVFDWLMFGFIYYLIAYDVLPIIILLTKKFLETNNLRYAILNGIVFSIALEQPTFILIYPLIWFLFVAFESRLKPKTVLSGLLFTSVSLLIWFLTSLSFLATFIASSKTTLSFYQGSFFEATSSQYIHLSPLLNPMRLWGSTYNFQFETYFPRWLMLFSFIPVLLAAVRVVLKPRDTRVLFLISIYLFVYLSYAVYVNLHYLVYRLPYGYGAVFEAPSVFLVPASLALAILIGHTSDAISSVITKLNNTTMRPPMRLTVSFAILVLIILAGIPWWTGQVSGNPNPGPPTKLNLYQLPLGYTKWSNTVPVNDDYFVLYIPLTGNVQITNTSYFSGPFEGVNAGIFTQANNLPFVSSINSTQLLNQLFSGSPAFGKNWGMDSIKYIVIYTNVQSPYNITYLLKRLSSQKGIVLIASLQDVVVYEDEYAKPVIYSNSSNVTTLITHIDPTSYRITATSRSPYLLIFNQAYSADWQASVNGMTLPVKDHILVRGGFNGWYINSTGNVIINIYYRPQTYYIIFLIISTGVFIGAIAYLTVYTVVDSRLKSLFTRIRQVICSL